MMNAIEWIKQFAEKIKAKFVAPYWKRRKLSIGLLQRHPVWHWRCHGINNANSSPLGRLNRFCLILIANHSTHAAHQTLARVLQRLPPTRSRFNGHAVSPTLLLGLLALFTILHTVTLQETMKSRKMSQYTAGRVIHVALSTDASFAYSCESSIV